MHEQTTTIVDLIDRGVRINPQALKSLKAWRKSKVWRGSVNERIEKMRTAHAALCEAYALKTTLAFSNPTAGGSSLNSYYDSQKDCIIIVGRVSVVTYLHLLALARGKDSTKAFAWSASVFRRIFPASFGRLVPKGLWLIHRDEAPVGAANMAQLLGE